MIGDDYNPQKTNNYMGKFLSEESRRIISNLIEKYKRLEEEASKPKPRTKTKRK